MKDRIKKVKYFSWLKKSINKNFTRMKRYSKLDYFDLRF